MRAVAAVVRMGAILALTVACGVVRAEGEKNRTGAYATKFEESDPRGDFKEMTRRKMPVSGGEKPAGDYDVKGYTFQVEVPSGCDPKTPAPLLVWITAANGGRMEDAYRDALAKRGFIYVGADGTGNDI